MITRLAIPLPLLVLAPCLLLGQATRSGSPVTGDIRPIVFRSGAAETNVIFGALAAGAAADDNNNDSVTHPIGGAQYFADPSIAIQETRSHIAWDVSYHPTLRFYVPRASHPDLFNQSLGGSLHYDVTKRLGIGLRQDYLRTSDPFQQLGDTPLQSGVGLGNRDGVVFLSDYRRTEILSQVDINYRLSKYTTLGIEGAFKEIHGNTLRSQPRSLIDTQDTLGSAFLSRQITARQAVGLQYQFLNIVFPGQDIGTRTHGLLLFEQIAISSGMNFSVFAGPEYSQIHNQVLVEFLGAKFKIPVSSTLWSPEVGAMFDWRGDRLGLHAGFVRRVSDGGGVQGAINLNDGFLNLTRKLGHRWVGNLDGELTRRTLLNQPGIDNLQVIELGGGISYELRDQLWIRTQYQRRQNIGGSQTALLLGNHDRVTLSVERNFTLPIGR